MNAKRMRPSARPRWWQHRRQRNLKPPPLLCSWEGRPSLTGPSRPRKTGGRNRGAATTQHQQGAASPQWAAVTCLTARTANAPGWAISAFAIWTQEPVHKFMVCGLWQAVFRHWDVRGHVPVVPERAVCRRDAAADGKQRAERSHGRQASHPLPSLLFSSLPSFCTG